MMGLTWAVPLWHGSGLSGVAVSPESRFLKHRRLIYVAISIVLGWSCEIGSNMRHGFVSARTAGILVECALLWIVVVFFFEIFSRRKFRSLIGWFRPIAWPGICLAVVILSWISGAWIFPDSSAVYLKLQRSYIDTHWQIDTATGVNYFPVDFDKAAPDGKRVIPWAFFVLDKESSLIVAPLTHELIRPRCPNDTYLVTKLEDQIYFVQQYSEPLASYLTPCLITPTQSNQP